MHTRPIFYSIVFSLVTLLLAGASFAGTLTVRQDGTGDYYTIPEAVAAASSYDTILVGPGTYTEYVEVDTPLFFISEAGASSTIMDGENARRHMTFLAGSGSYVEGFTFKNAYCISGAGSIFIRLGATAGIRDCKFENNSTDFDGGAVSVSDP